MKQERTRIKKARTVARLLDEKVTDCIQVEGKWYAVEIFGTRAIGIESSDSLGRGSSRYELLRELEKQIKGVRSRNDGLFPTVYSCHYSVQFPVSKEERK